MTQKSMHFWFATWFGTGLAPKAPGTVGTLATVPLHFLLVQLPTAAHLIFLIGFVVGLPVFIIHPISSAYYAKKLTKTNKGVIRGQPNIKGEKIKATERLERLSLLIKILAFLNVTALLVAALLTK